VSFPEQVQFDAVLPGEFLNASFSDNIITDFELDGTIINTFPHNSGRGIYRLGNGNFLATNNAGIFELDAVTGAVVQTENTGQGRFIELYQPPTGINESTFIKESRSVLVASPNPFVANVQFRFSVLKPGLTEAVVYSVAGIRVAMLIEGPVLAGEQILFWDGRNDNGLPVPEGVYFLRVQTPERTLNQKLIHLK
jgi:hypothetical protein